MLQFIYRFAAHYTQSRREEEDMSTKGKIAVVDLRDESNTKELFEQYRFLDKKHTEFLLNGFNEDVVNHFASVQASMGD